MRADSQGRMDFLSESFMRFRLIYYIEMAIYERCLQGYNQCMRQRRRYHSNAQDLKKNHCRMSNYILQEHCPIDPDSIYLILCIFILPDIKHTYSTNNIITKYIHVYDFKVIPPSNHCTGKRRRGHCCSLSRM